MADDDTKSGIGKIGGLMLSYIVAAASEDLSDQK